MKVKVYDLVNSVDQEELDAGLLAESFSVEAKQGKAGQDRASRAAKYKDR